MLVWLAGWLVALLPCVADKRPTCIARRFAEPPVVDGDLREWLDDTPASGAPANVPPPLTINRRDQVVVQHPDGSAEQGEGAVGGWRGPNDLSASFYVGFDDRYLYLAGHVKDDGIAYDDSTWWEGDAI